MKTNFQNIVIPYYGDFDSALKHVSLFTTEMSTLKIIVVYAISSRMIFGSGHLKNKPNSSTRIIQTAKSELIKTVESKIQDTLPDISANQLVFRFGIGSWVDVLQKTLDEEKCDLLLLGYKDENAFDRLFGTFYSTVFRISSITSIVVKVP